MIPVSHAYWQAAKAGAQEIFLSVITNPRGRMLYGTVWPSQAMRNFFGGVSFYDGSRSLGDGGRLLAMPLSDVGNRLINPGSLKQTLAPILGDLPVSLGQTERGAVSTEYDNRDQHFCVLFGDQYNEPILLQELALYHGFFGIDPADFLNIFSGWITSLRYNASRLILVAEAQATTYPTIDLGTSKTAYALSATSANPATVLVIPSGSAGGDPEDAGPTGHPLTLNGGLTYSATQAGKWNQYAIEFDGSSESISIADHADFHFGTDDFHIGMWAYLTANQYSRYFIVQGDGGGSRWDMENMNPFGDSARYLAFNKSSSLQASSEIPLNEWVYLCVQRTSGVVKGYYNATEVFSGTLTTDFNLSHTVTIGWGTAVLEVGVDPYFQGYLDDVYLLNGASIDPANLPPTGPWPSALNPVMARSTYTHSQLASVFFATDDWSCIVNCTKDTLDESGILFSLENAGSATTLEIGITGTNYLYVKTGQDVEGTPATTTYTDTHLFVASTIAGNLNLSFHYSHTTSQLTFRVNGISNTQSATVPYDRTGTNDEQITIGEGWQGKILNVKFNETFFAMNNFGVETLTTIPDVIGGHGLAVQDARWSVW